MADNELTPAQIDAITERGTKFLSAASQNENIRVMLDRGGYTEEEHKRGWEMLLDLLGYKNTASSASGPPLRQRQAAAELDAYDGPSFDRARAALDHRFPSQAAYVFEGLTAKTGAESIGAVRTFVDRVASLRDGTDPTRVNTREDDTAAAALLASRHIIDADEERRLRALIAEATSLADMPTLSVPSPSARQQTARTLDAWLRDWRETARVLVTRRDYQIRMGLVTRRSPQAAGGESEE